MVVAAVPSLILPDFISLLIHSLYLLMLWRETYPIHHKVLCATTCHKYSTHPTTLFPVHHRLVL